MPDHAEHLQKTRDMIRRHKRKDSLFGMLGMGLIVASLSVLLVLMGKLLYDGTSRLLATQEVKPTGIAPGRGEIIGTLIRAGDAWEIKPDRIWLDTIDDTVDFTPLAGRRVAVEGRPPRPDDTQMLVDAVRPIEPGFRIEGEVNIVGTLTGETRDRSGARLYELDAEPMALTLPTTLNTTKLAELEGKRIAVDGRRRANDGTINVRVIEPLVAKTFFSSMPDQTAYRAGILAAIIGTLLVMIVTALTTIPLGVAAGVYLEEYAPKNRLTRIIEINIANLAGVPSIIWGLMGLGLFIFAFGMERSILAAGMTLGLLVLPIVIIATREAIRAIPGTIREASMALGATKWQTVRHHIIPYSMSGILTGSIIALSRAIGETAPLVVIGAALFINFLPIDVVVPADAMRAHQQAVAIDPLAQPPEGELTGLPLGWLDSKFTVIPMQIFSWVSRPETEFQDNAAAAGVVLVLLTLGLNGIAIWIRYRLRRKIKW